MRNNLPQTLPPGRLDDLRTRPDADLIAYRKPMRWDGECLLKRYSSRKALEAFCREGGQWNALVKTPVHPNMLTNANHQHRSL